jgi:hypothetical protein
MRVGPFSAGYSSSPGVERAARQTGIDTGHVIILAQADLAGQLFEEMRPFQAIRPA